MSFFYLKIDVSVVGIAFMIVCAALTAHVVLVPPASLADRHDLLLALSVISGACWLIGSICATGPFYSSSVPMQILGYIVAILNAVGAITTVGVAALSAVA